MDNNKYCQESNKTGTFTHAGGNVKWYSNLAKTVYGFLKKLNIKFIATPLLKECTQKKWKQIFKQKLIYRPGWCGSGEWVLACKPNGHWLDSQSGHMPRLQAKSPVRGTQETTTHWSFSPSLSLSFPLSLKVNK